MNNLAKRIERIEREIGTRKHKVNLPQAMEKLQQAVNLSISTAGDCQAIGGGRWQDLSQETQRAWQEFYAVEQYTPEEIEVHRRRWQRTMPALVQSLNETTGAEEGDDGFPDIGETPGCH